MNTSFLTNNLIFTLYKIWLPIARVDYKVITGVGVWSRRRPTPVRVNGPKLVRRCMIDSLIRLQAYGMILMCLCHDESQHFAKRVVR
jgi:hypothetical protein